MKTMQLEEYLKIKDKARTIDVRTKSEVKSLKNFPWAENIYVYDIFDQFNKFFKDKNELIITVCNAGNRSGEAASFLEHEGFTNAYVLVGGIYGYYRHKK